MKHYDFDVALIPSQSALASLLRVSPNWRVVEEDAQAILFRRVGQAILPAAGFQPAHRRPMACDFYPVNRPYPPSTPPR